ncbi:MAG: hypothetical protein HY908_12890 [Myxococcales bacterium]|nr:hypothetical protein [Myxococcales bacterium]
MRAKRTRAWGAVWLGLSGGLGGGLGALGCGPALPAPGTQPGAGTASAASAESARPGVTPLAPLASGRAPSSAPASPSALPPPFAGAGPCAFRDAACQPLVRPTALAFSPDGTRFFTTHADGALREWQRDSGELVRSATVGSAFTHVVGLAVTRELVVVGMGDGRILVRALSEPDRELGTIQAFERERTEGSDPLFEPDRATPVVTRIAVAPDGRELAVVGADERPVRFFALPGGEPGRVLPPVHVDSPMPFESGRDHGYQALAFSPDGRYFASCGTRLQLVERSSGAVVQSAGGARGAWSSCDEVAFGTTRFAAFVDDALRVWDAGDGREVGPVHARGSRLALSDDGSALASWETRPGAAVAGVGADGQWHVAQSSEGERQRAQALTLCHVADGTCRTLGGEHGGVVGAAFAPRTTTVVTLHRDGTIERWDAASPAPGAAEAPRP